MKIRDFYEKTGHKVFNVGHTNENYTKQMLVNEIKNKFGIELINKPKNKIYDIAVAHNQFKKISLKQIKSFMKKKHIIYDLKHIFKGNEVDGGF